MISYYSIVQYVPDIVRGESINVGVVTFGSSEVFVRSVFVDPSPRSRAFGLSATMIKAIEGKFSRFKSKDLLEASKSWFNSIRVTEPRASIKDSANLLLSVVKNFLPDERMALPSRMTRDEMKSIAVASLKTSVGRTVNRAASKMISLNASSSVVGGRDSHLFDVGLTNGKPLFGANLISFDGSNPRQLSRFIDASAWTISDIRQVDKEVDLSILVSEASPEHELTAKRAKVMFIDLGAKVVPVADATSWADNIAAMLSKHLQP